MLENINTLRERLLYEVNNSNPETLELFYNFIQVIKKATKKEKLTTNDKHPLAEFAGMFSYDEGQEMIDCINR